MAVEPGAFRTRAYAGFDGEPIEDSLPEYRSLLDGVRSAMAEQNGNQPGDPQRGARAVLAAMALDSPPHRLVLGGAGFDAATAALAATLSDLRAHKTLLRGADSPPGH